MNDSDLKQQHDSIIQKLRDVDEQDFQTKTGLVRELIDVSRPLLKKKLIEISAIIPLAREACDFSLNSSLPSLSAS